MPLPRTLAALTVSLSLAACQPADPDGAACAGGKCDGLGGGDDASLCVAVRGNGERIPAHFAALARLVEHYGTLDAMAGGSSAAVTAFLYDSMATGDVVQTCGDVPCDEAEQAARTALLLKSLQGYLEVVAAGPEASAIRHLAPLAGEIRAQGLGALAETDVEAARDALLELLGSDDVRDLINPRMIEILTESADPAFHVRDVIAGIEKLGAFEADDVRIFLRPGLVDFAAFATLIGRVGSFYAGRGPTDRAGMDAWAAGCAGPGVGKPWPELAALPLGASTCGARFAELLASYRAAFAADPLHDVRANRADDEAGASFPVLIGTSVIDGAGADAMRAARASYLAGQVPTLDMSFDDVRFGYFGRADHVRLVADNPRGFDDLKTAKMVALEPTAWADVLTLSPAEPGLAEVQELPDGRISAGGWSDLHPVQALENLGCDAIVYLTREGGESPFAEGVARQLGMTDADRAALYDLDAPDSSFSGALDLADAVWCTNWNDGNGDPAVLARDAYGAPMESVDPFFTEAPTPYPNLEANLDRPGC